MTSLRSGAPVSRVQPLVMMVVGARPNYMKIAPLVRAMRQSGRLTPYVVHTGQHYDPLMNEVFFSELAIPPPDKFLAVGSGTHAVQTATIMQLIEPIIEDIAPDTLLVVGDV